MDRRGIPQIFAGYAIYFNGVIPKSIHPSHSVEWRMAERHGAVCLTRFDPTTVNILVYRPGYERSEKCRACIEKYTHIPAVSISWMLDSLLQSRQIHVSFYRLLTIPDVANPTVRGTNLPHHQHPFYLINKVDYSIPTSFLPEKKVAKELAVKLEDHSISAGMNLPLPPFFEINAPQYTNVNVYTAAVNCAAAKITGSAANDEDDEVEEHKAGAHIDLILSQQDNNRIDPMLFSGCRMVLSPTLASQKDVVHALKSCGANLGNTVDQLRDCMSEEATYVIFHQQDKKCELMIAAAQMQRTDLPRLQLAQSNWLEDCLMLGELLPLSGMYVPTAKLLETLSKKFEKRS